MNGIILQVSEHMVHIVQKHFDKLACDLTHK